MLIRWARGPMSPHVQACLGHTGVTLGARRVSLWILGLWADNQGSCSDRHLAQGSALWGSRGSRGTRLPSAGRLGLAWLPTGHAMAVVLPLLGGAGHMEPAAGHVDLPSFWVHLARPRTDEPDVCYKACASPRVGGDVHA